MKTLNKTNNQFDVTSNKNSDQFVASLYLGINKEYPKSSVVIIPVPYDGTVSYKKGAAKGPGMIISASTQLETFDIESEKDILEEVSIHTTDTLDTDMLTSEQVSNEVSIVVNKAVIDMKFPVVLGGEHSITYGCVSGILNSGLIKNPKDLTIVQIDAHSDLMDEYDKNKFSHACVMRRVYELGVNVVQVGIRCQSREEHDFIKQEKIKNIFYMPFEGSVNLKHNKLQEKNYKAIFNKIIDACTDNVYVTIDVDGFDPCLIPATGTPVPGGLGWYEALDFFKQLFTIKNVVGFDVVELADIGNSGDTRSEDTIALLIKKLLTYKFLMRKS